jgi:hypothetical protein
MCIRLDWGIRLDAWYKSMTPNHEYLRQQKQSLTEMVPFSIPIDSLLVSGLKDIQEQESRKRKELNACNLYKCGVSPLSSAIAMCIEGEITDWGSDYMMEFK